MSEINFHKLREHKKGHYARGGKTEHEEHPDEAQDKKLIKKMVGKAKIKLRKGGDVHGEEAPVRLDKKQRFARGGAAKHKGEKGTKVNVIVAGGGGGQPPMGAIPPHPPMPPQAGAGAPPQMPPRPPMAPPGAGAPPPGGPGPLKRGGRAYARGGKIGTLEHEHDEEHHDIKGVKSNLKRPEMAHDKERHEPKRKRGGRC